MAIRCTAWLRAMVVAIVCLTTPAGFAQQRPQQPQSSDQHPQTPLAALDPLRLALDQLDARLGREGATDKDLIAMRSSLDPVRDDIASQTESLEKRLNDLDVRLKQIGAPPAAGAPPEDPTIATERTRLTERRAEVDPALKQARLLALRGDDLANRITDRRRSLFTRELLARTASVFDPGFWRQAAATGPDNIRGVTFLARSWWGYAWDNGGFSGLGGALLALIALSAAAIMLTRWWRRRAVLRANGATRFARASSSLIVLLRLSLTMPAVVASLVFVVEAFGLVPPRMVETMLGLFVAVAVASFGRAVAIALCAPDEPERRLLRVGDRTARRLAWHLTAAARVVGFVIFINIIQKAIVAPVAATVALSAIMAAITAALLIQLLVRLGRDDDTDETQTAVERRGQWLRGGGWLLAIAIVVSLGTGYVGFGAFLAGRFLTALAVIGALYILLEFVDSLFTEVLTAQSHRGRSLALTFGLNPQNIDLIGTLMSAVIRMLLVLVALFPLLGPGGIFAADFFGVAREAGFGIRIGDVSISLVAVLGGLVVLLLGILLTRAAQRWLQRRFLPRTTLEPSLQHSVSTIFGYVGVVATLFLALSSVGIDLQKITLVAGALSIGIGFGLQSVVSNFVSGLIVLAERPIRVGDLIEVKGERGHVRRIRVRATEIETGDQASLIVPNSELITGVVKNWTHSNTLGRIAVTVRVGYDSDPETVRNILLNAAREHRGVVRSPGPVALLNNFGEYALEFELGCMVANVDEGGMVRSDLRFAILKALRAEGIAIPYPQREVRQIGSGSSAIVS